MERTDLEVCIKCYYWSDGPKESFGYPYKIILQNVEGNYLQLLCIIIRRSADRIGFVGGSQGRLLLLLHLHDQFPVIGVFIVGI